MKKEQTVDYNVKRLWHSISRMYNQFGLEYEITASSGYVLLNIDIEKGSPATKIAPALGMEARSLTRMLKSMEEKGWVYREKDPNDGRSVRVFLTQKGLEKRELSKKAVKAFNKKAKQIVTEEKLSTFISVVHEIEKIVDNPHLFAEVQKQIINGNKNHK